MEKSNRNIPVLLGAFIATGMGIAAVHGYGMIAASLISVVWLTYDFSRGNLRI